MTPLQLSGLWLAAFLSPDPRPLLIHRWCRLRREAPLPPEPPEVPFGDGELPALLRLARFQAELALELERYAQARQAVFEREAVEAASAASDLAWKAAEDIRSLRTPQETVLALVMSGGLGVAAFACDTFTLLPVGADFGGADLDSLAEASSHELAVTYAVAAACTLLGVVPAHFLLEALRRVR